MHSLSIASANISPLYMPDMHIREPRTVSEGNTSGMYVPSGKKKSGIEECEMTGRTVTELLLPAAIISIVVSLPGQAQAQGSDEVRQQLPDTVYIVERDPSAISDIFVKIAEDVGPSVVTVTSTTTFSAVVPSFPSLPFGFPDPWGGDWEGAFPAPREEEFTMQGLGSGVIISEDGYIVTNHHVAGEADDLEVILSTGERYPAVLAGTDPRADVAVIRIDAENLPAIRLGDSDELKVGQWVLAIGSPFALSQTVTQGIVSYIGRSGVGLADYENYIQTDAAINPGNSGGALVNLRGELVGINTAIASRTGSYQGVGFAIPVNAVSDIMEDLLAHGYVLRGWLGVSIQNLSPELAMQFGLEEGAGGILIADILEDTPAEESGLERGDIVLAVDGRNVASVQEFREMIAAIDPGMKVTLRILRDGTEIRKNVILDQQPESYVAYTSTERVPEIGWRLLELTREIAARLGDEELRGVLVEQVEPGGSAAEAGILRGDVLMEVDRTPVSTPSEVESILSASSGDALLLVWRQGTTIYQVLDR
jgi:serine protease Do